MICSKCGEDKNESCFFYRKRDDNLYKHCKACHNPTGKDSKFSSSWWIERFDEEELKLFSKLKNLCTKAKLRNQEFDPDIDWENLYDIWVEQNGRCAYSGMPLSIETNHPHTVSLDRTDSSKGYVRGNLKLLSWSVNKMKQDLKEDEFLELCFLITEKQKKTT